MLECRSFIFRNIFLCDQQGWLEVDDENVRLFRIMAWIGSCPVICLQFCDAVVMIFGVIIKLAFFAASFIFAVDFWTFERDIS